MTRSLGDLQEISRLMVISREFLPPVDHHPGRFEEGLFYGQANPIRTAATSYNQ